MAKRITAGDLEYRVTFESETRTEVDGGQIERTWSESTTRRAHVRPVSGRERFQADQLENPTRYEVHIRYPRGSWAPDETMRIKWRGQTFGIRTIHWAGPREPFLQIDCEAGVRAEE